MVGKLDKETMIMGAGAGIGVIQTVVTKEYVDANFGNFPGIGDMIPAPWGRWSTFGNILIGGICFGLSTFTGLIKNYSIVKFLQAYGITTLVGGIVNGVFPGTVIALGRARRPAMRLAPRVAARVGVATPTTQPGTTILA